MELPFISSAPKKKRTQTMAVDLGTRTTKAVLMERRGEVMALTRFALLDAPIAGKKLSPELLSEHLRSVSEALGGAAKGKFVTLAVGLDDAIVRQVDLPQIPVDEMRLVLKNNTKGFLQQDLPNYVFDCNISLPKTASQPQPNRRNHGRTQAESACGRGATTIGERFPNGHQERGTDGGLHRARNHRANECV